MDPMIQRLEDADDLEDLIGAKDSNRLSEGLKQVVKMLCSETAMALCPLATDP